MISNPKAGWCDFLLDGFSAGPSYLTDVPLDLIDCFTSVLKTGCGACNFDEEGSRFVLVIADEEIFILDSSREEPECIRIYRNVYSLIKEFIDDINKNFQEWLMWLPVIDEESLEPRKIEILEGLTYLKYETEKRLSNYYKEKELIEEFIH